MPKATQHPTNNESRLLNSMVSTESAPLRSIERFARRGENYLWFACHAAVPLALTTDLLYSLWAEFRQDSGGEPLDMPWIVVADLLFSGLCEEVGTELYELRPAARSALLARLREEERFGQGRLDAVARFVWAYGEARLRSDDPDEQDLGQVLCWSGRAVLEPEGVARELMGALGREFEADAGEVVRLATIVEGLREPLAAFPEVGMYARGLKAVVFEDFDTARDEFQRLKLQRRVSSQSLPVVLPKISKTQKQAHLGALFANRSKISQALLSVVVTSLTVYLLILMGVLQVRLESLNQSMNDLSARLSSLLLKFEASLDLSEESSSSQDAIISQLNDLQNLLISDLLEQHRAQNSNVIVVDPLNRESSSDEQFLAEKNILNSDCRQVKNDTSIYEARSTNSQVVDTVFSNEIVILSEDSPRLGWIKISSPENGYIQTSFLSPLCRVLRPGSTGSAVAELQTLLTEHGFSIQNSDSGEGRGVFGPQTEAAVMAFQRQENLPVNGVVDYETLRALQINNRSRTVISTRTCAVITGDRTFIYFRPSINSPTEYIFDSGDVVLILGLSVSADNRDWVEVESVIDSEWSGFIPISAIGEQLNCPLPLGIPPENSQCHIAAVTTGVRLGRNIDLPIVGEINRGDQFFLETNMVTDSNGRVWAKRSNTGDIDLWIEFQENPNSLPNLVAIDDFNCSRTKS
ncbi:MAG: peptidoglycan-binding domain-containing protein [Spirulinaceae cyanobacterium]